MKGLIVIFLAAGVLASASAQLSGPSALTF
jgi:hypothetical protein